MEIVGGFLNGIIPNTACSCHRYSLPFRAGESFDIVVKNREYDAVLEGFSFSVLATHDDYEVIRFTPLANVQEGSIFFGLVERPINLLCGTVIEDYCTVAISEYCLPLYESGITCFHLNTDCYSMFLEYELKFSWGWQALKQRLPIYYTNMQAKTNNVKIYQSTSGIARRVGRLQTYYEYTLKVDLVTDEFHKMLHKIFLQGRNIKINGKSYDFGGDYDIKTEQDDFCVRMATCKIVEKNGLKLNCE
jgi:hypothetical protein